MGIKLKPLSEQVIVITGASSGIGLATARKASEKGAKVVLGARSVGVLNALVAEIESKGGEAVAVECDVTERDDVEDLAREAIDAFGRIDTWVNNAGLGMFGRIEQSEESDCRKLFDVNFWGIFNGSLTALPYLKDNGGALINVGSEVSEDVPPLQGIYSATKHAVKGLTDGLRLEIQEIDNLPVSITLIQPTAVNTPFPEHAKNYMSEEPKLPTPMIEPEKVADAILAAAETPTRATRVGILSKLNTTIATLIPALGDKMAAKQLNRQQYDEAPRNPDGALYVASEATDTAGRAHGIGGVEKQ